MPAAATRASLPRATPCAAPASGTPLTTAEDEAQFQEWLRSMEAQYRLVARENYPLTFFVHENELKFVDQVELTNSCPPSRAWRIGPRRSGSRTGTGHWECDRLPPVLGTPSIEARSASKGVQAPPRPEPIPLGGILPELAGIQN